jgi:hypothetical protein
MDDLHTAESSDIEADGMHRSRFKVIFINLSETDCSTKDCGPSPDLSASKKTIFRRIST